MHSPYMRRADDIGVQEQDSRWTAVRHCPCRPARVAGSSAERCRTRQRGGRILATRSAPDAGWHSGSPDSTSSPIRSVSTPDRPGPGSTPPWTNLSGANHRDVRPAVITSRRPARPRRRRRVAGALRISRPPRPAGHKSVLGWDAAPAGSCGASDRGTAGAVPRHRLPASIRSRRSQSGHGRRHGSGTAPRVCDSPHSSLDEADRLANQIVAQRRPVSAVKPHELKSHACARLTSCSRDRTRSTRPRPWCSRHGPPPRPADRRRPARRGLRDRPRADRAASGLTERRRRHCRHRVTANHARKCSAADPYPERV